MVKAITDPKSVKIENWLAKICWDLAILNHH